MAECDHGSQKQCTDTHCSEGMINAAQHKVRKGTGARGNIKHVIS